MFNKLKKLEDNMATMRTKMEDTQDRPNMKNTISKI